MKPVEVLGVETDENDRVVAILGSRQLIEACRDQFPGARIIIRKPVLIELKLPDLPAPPARKMMPSEKPRVTLELYALAPTEGSLDFKLTGTTLEGNEIADVISAERMAARTNMNVIEGERAIYTLLGGKING